MKKVNFIAHKKRVKEENIKSFAEIKNIPIFEAQQEWEREYRNPIKGAMPTLHKRVNLFAR